MRLIQKSFQENRHDLIIMPGVGSFDSGVRSLKEKNIFDDIKRWGNDNNPILGVCLGFQLMFDGSEEGSESGLSFVDGLCRRFNGDTPVPRMEWGKLIGLSQKDFIQISIMRGIFLFTLIMHLEINLKLQFQIISKIIVWALRKET